MSQLTRHDILLRHLAEHGLLSVDRAVELLDASPATVRRDFALLARQGSAVRVRGGIRSPRPDPMPAFAAREYRYSAEKQALARAAGSLLEPGQVVFIDGGTTTFHLAACLPEIPLRIITNSLRLAAALEESARPEVEVFLTGGFLYPKSGLLVGPGAQASLAQYHADWAFLSAGGVTDEGLFNTNELVVESERIMIAHADRIAVLADHSKIGKTAMCRVCGLDQVHMLVTDPSPQTQPTLDRWRGMDLQVVSAVPGAAENAG